MSSEDILNTSSSSSIDTRPIVYVCGNNYEGQTGVKGVEGNLLEPTEITRTVDFDPQMILAISSHLKQTYIVTKDYQLLSAGENEHGELGRAGKRNIFLNIDMLSRYRIREVATGEGFCHACTVDGRVISWGKNDLGQLGNGDRERDEKPKLNSNFSEQILQISAGDSHVIALSKGGNVLTWGGNRKGQLGDGQLTSSCVPKISPILRHRPVIGICAGANHCMAYTVTGSLYVWGDNTKGQLGLGDTNLRPYPTLVRSLRSAKVCGVAAGQMHSAAVSPNGLVFTWGSNSSGQLGIGDSETKMSSVPVTVDKLRDRFSIQVACGSAHTLIVCRSNNTNSTHFSGQDDTLVIYGMGLNNCGQLGISGSSTFYSPQKLAFNSNIPIGGVLSGCSALHSYIYTKGVPIQRSPLPIIDLETLTNDCKQLINQTNTNDRRLQALQILREHIASGFSSISVLNASFLNKDQTTRHDLAISTHPTTCLVNLVSVREAYTLLLNTKEESVLSTLGRATLKLTEQLKECPYDDIENLNCFLIVLENPLLLHPETFHVGIERVITGILALPPTYRTILFGWLRSYEQEYFSRIVQVMNNYLTFILSSTVSRFDTSPVTLVLNSLYECNHQQQSQQSQALQTSEHIVSDDLFYNETLKESINVIAEYEIYLKNEAEDKTNSIFNYIRYPFLLPISLKRTLVLYDARKLQFQIMSYFATNILSKSIAVIPRYLGMVRSPDGVLDLGTLHLSLAVSRQYMVYDLLRTLKEVINAGNEKMLLLPLRLSIMGEEAVDYGGVTKEVFSICIQQFVKCMKRTSDGHLVWFEEKWTGLDLGVVGVEDNNNNSIEVEKIHEMQQFMEELMTSNSMAFYLGVLVSLALYHGVLIQLPLPTSVYKHLQNSSLTISDLYEADFSLAKGYTDLLSYDTHNGPIADVFGINFTISKNPLLNSYEFCDLIENGSEILVDQSNRQQYVNLSINFALYGCCNTQMDAFIKGLRITNLTDKALRFCTAKEIDCMINGNRDIDDYDLSLLRFSTTYKGVFHDEHPVIQWFWDIVSSLNSELKHKFLAFVTGTDRVPIEGITNVGLIIQSTEQSPESIPTSHTCFNILELSREYASKEQLQQKLLIALEHSIGFGFA